jgi:hypothetical protein
VDVVEDDELVGVVALVGVDVVTEADFVESVEVEEEEIEDDDDEEAVVIGVSLKLNIACVTKGVNSTDSAGEKNPRILQVQKLFFEKT